MLYSRILSQQRSPTQAQKQRAIALFYQVKAGLGSDVSPYDLMLLKTTDAILEKGILTQFDDDDDYFQSEFVQMLTAGMKTIATYDSREGRWVFANPQPDDESDIAMGYHQDEFAIMHLEGNVNELINLLKQPAA